jgi:hypothetical protein
VSEEVGSEASMYERLAVDAPDTYQGSAMGPDRRPETTFTATIETIDNDRATALLGGVGYP